MTHRIKSLLILLFALTGFSFSQEGPRYALVIGNSDYVGMASLANPVNDALDMRSALERLGFTVQMVTNADLSAIESAVLTFGQRLSTDPRSIGLFFYAGHAVQSQGVNYLIPSKTSITSEAFLKTKAIASQSILDIIQQSGNALNLVFLDACRDNPYGWARSATRGLSVVANQPPGSIVVYATSAGSVAQDGDGRNGVFTGALLQNIELPGLTLNQILDRTAAAVQRTTQGAQVPAIYKQHFDTVVLKGGAQSTQNTNQPQFGEVVVTTGDLIITVESPAEVSLLGQSVSLPAGGRLPIRDVSEGPVGIDVRYTNGHRESRNVYVEQGRENLVRFEYKEGIQPPTDIYVYGLMDTSLWVDDQYTMFLDEAHGENNYILRNELGLGKHAIWWLNHTSMYAYIFELKSGVNRISPRFKQFMLPEMGHKFEFDDGEGPTTVSEDFDFVLHNKQWEPTEYQAKITMTMSRELSADANLQKEQGFARYFGEIQIDHPWGEVNVPIDEVRDFGQNYRSTDFTEVYRNDDIKIEYKLYMSRDFISVDVNTYHLRPSDR
jgi:hypothetical protein